MLFFGKLYGQFKRIIKLENYKALASNFLSLSVLQLATYLFPLIVTPYIAKTIGLEKYGLIAFAASFCMYFTTFVDFGFNYSATRDVAKNQKDNLILKTIPFTY